MDTATVDVLRGALARAELFRAAAPVTLAAVAAATLPRALTKDELLFETGDPSDGLYIVLDGTLRLTLSTPDGGELIVREAEAGDVLGEIGALDGGPRSAHARGVSPSSRLAFLSRPRLDRLMLDHPDLAVSIMRTLCTRLRATTEQLEGIALYPLRMRVARFLMARGARGGHARSDGRRAVSLTLSQSALASVLGASRPKVNGAIAELEKAGIIERRGALVIYDPDRLQAEAEGTAGS